MSELNQEHTALEQNLIRVKAPYRTARYPFSTGIPISTGIPAHRRFPQQYDSRF